MCSVDYYNQNSQSFYDRTIYANVQDLYDKFLKYAPAQCCILDAGCGVGRDSKFFLNQGYDVVAFDGSLEMTKIASNLIGKDVLHMFFQDINFSAEFDAIWASASLLHVPYQDLRGIIQRFHNALVPSGILYASFKYGTFMRHIDNRFFFDMDESTIKTYLEGLFEPIKIWKTADDRSKVAASPDKSWLNLIARRI